MLKIIDNIGKFLDQNNKALDRALNRMAIDIERLAKQTVPFDKGQLKASGYHTKVGNLNYRTIFNKEYAAFQEFGMRRDGSHVVRRYSHTGKKAHYLGDAGKTIASRALDYIRQEARSIKI
jgi:hypothetical protein